METTSKHVFPPLLEGRFRHPRTILFPGLGFGADIGRDDGSRHPTIILPIAPSSNCPPSEETACNVRPWERQRRDHRPTIGVLAEAKLHHPNIILGESLSKRTKKRNDFRVRTSSGRLG